MSTKVAVVAASLALILVVASGFLYSLWQDAQTLVADRESERDALGRRLGVLEDDFSKSQGDLEKARSLESALRSRIAALQRAAEAPASPSDDTTDEATGTDATPAGPRSDPNRRDGPYVLESIEDADALVAAFVAKGDLRGLWLLAADLLGHGEPGYEKIIELSRLLDGRDKELQEKFQLWSREETMVGPFLRAVSENHEDLLRFGLWLDRQEGEKLPEMIEEMHEELSDDLGPVLLGYYDGDDPEILDGYAERFAARLSGDLANTRNNDEMIAALGQIPTARSNEVLISLLERADGRLVADIARALAWQGNPRSVPALQAVLERTTDDNTARLVQAAIAFLSE